MTTYEISNTKSGAVVWTGEAKSAADALNAMSRDAGYMSHAHACSVTGDDGDDLIVCEVDPDCATDSQIATIRARRINAIARTMMAEGVTLSHEQVDDLGDEGIDWIRTRLGLSVIETDRGVECVVL